MTKSSGETTIQITGLSNFGQGFSYIQNDPKKRKIFVSKTIPGDEIEARIVSQNSKFVAANLIKIISPGKNRVEAPCPYFTECGGCSLQHLSDEYYQEFKKNNLNELLKISEIFFDNDIVWSFVGSSSRRRVVFHVDVQNRLGFYREQSHDVVKIDECLILEKELSALILPLQNLILEIASELKINQISATKFDNGIALVLHTNFAPNIQSTKLLTDFAKEHNVISLSYKIADDCNLIYQSKAPQALFDYIKTDLHPDIFLQATSQGQKIISNEINNLISLFRSKKNISDKTLSVIDLYCGIGTYSFAALAADEKLKISAFEGDEKMINLLNRNSLKNNLSQNLKGFAKDLVKNPLRADELKNYDLAIINPPRNGALAQIENIAKSKINNLIYISCNPAAFAVDARILIENGFKITKIKAVDQFVYSPHLELVAIFERCFFGNF